MFAMYISNQFNIIYNNNQKYNSAKNKNVNKSIFFGAKSDILTKEISLNADEFNEVFSIAKAYEKVLSVFSSFNGVYQKKFKSLYPNLAFGEKIKGFVFNSIEGLKDKKLQIVRFNTKDNSDELLTFGILDSENKNILRYRVNKFGKVLVSSEKDNVNKLSVNPFESSNNLDYGKYLSDFSEEMKRFEFYSEHFKEINRATAKRTDKEVFSVVSDLHSVIESKGLKSEIEILDKNYKDLQQVLNLKKGKDALALKQSYFGPEFSSRTKGLVFENVGADNNIVSYCPLFSKDDNRVFKIVIMDNNKNPKTALVFFADGRVAKQKKIDLDTNGYRSNNLLFISDKEIEQLDLKNVFATINTKISEFKDYVVEKRGSIVQRRDEIKEGNKIKKEEQKLLKAQKAEKRAEIKSKKEALALEKEERKQRRLEARRIKEEAIAKKLELKKLNALAREEKIRLANQRREELKLQKEKLKIEKTLAKKDKVIKVPRIAYFYPGYKNLYLNDVNSALTKLFDTPVEKRSNHLIHERFQDGKIFAGRLYLKASDGAYITVSRIKSPKYVDFIYYSIKIEKDGKEFTFNLDSVNSRILVSKNGKPVINNDNKVLYCRKEDFIEQNPEAKNLPKYLNEIFELKSTGEKEFITPKLKITNNQDLLNQKEQDVAEALEKNLYDDIFD